MQIVDYRITGFGSSGDQTFSWDGIQAQAVPIPSSEGGIPFFFSIKWVKTIKIE